MCGTHKFQSSAIESLPVQDLRPKICFKKTTCLNRSTMCGNIILSASFLHACKSQGKPHPTARSTPRQCGRLTFNSATPLWRRHENSRPVALFLRSDR
jgi:hypothetical protein